MPIHDWTRVEAGIYHAFHHEWISEISRALNRGLLPNDYYALPEQHAGGFGPDVLTLQDPSGQSKGGGVATAPRTKPQTTYHAQSPGEFYRRKQSAIAICHVSGDRTVAMIEITSPGNKNHKHSFNAFIQKAVELIEYRVHLLIVDPFPPTSNDPNGLHGTIWSQIDNTAPFTIDPNKPLSLVAYECGLVTDAYLEPIAVGDTLPNMPLFLAPNQYIFVPLEATYQAAWDTVPSRWKRVIEAPT